jgi:hypothetical protein
MEMYSPTVARLRLADVRHEMAIAKAERERRAALIALAEIAPMPPAVALHRAERELDRIFAARKQTTPNAARTVPRGRVQARSEMEIR